MNPFMEYNVAYVAITDPKWVNFCFPNSLNTVSIWSRKKAFKVIPKGFPIFFLEKGTRYIKGYGYFKAFEVSTVSKSWNEYKLQNGASNYNEYLKMLNLPCDVNSNKKEVGNIIVEKVEWSNKKVSVDSLGVDFHKAIVSGKRIYTDEINKIIKCI
jgi:hypothetical protein